jgi:hypothetical protein
MDYLQRPIDSGYRVGGTVPDGLTLNPTTGNISGTPTGADTWYFQAAFTDATGVILDQGFLSIEIASPFPLGSPVPFLNQRLVPTFASPGSPGFPLRVSGTGFSPNSTVNFNHTALATTFVNREHLTAAVPASSLANAGTAAITVVTPVPGGESNVVYFPVGSSNVAVSFAPAPNSPLMVRGPGVVAGDFNEDGKPDLIVSTVESFYVFLGNGDGTFTQTSASPISVPSPPYADEPSPYAVADFNGDGKLDLAVANITAGTVSILLQQ